MLVLNCAASVNRVYLTLFVYMVIKTIPMSSHSKTAIQVVPFHIQNVLGLIKWVREAEKIGIKNITKVCTLFRYKSTK